jgi:peptidoglycan/xylan/chitin deacetylase (PgdA/CDA1 family)
LPALVAVAVFFLVLYVVWRVRFGQLAPDRPAVICFHKISSRFCWEGTWTTPGRFFAYVDRLLGAGYRFVPIGEFLDAAGSDGLGKRDLVLTFDDGYRELYDVVLPGLERRGVPFHVFLVTDYVGRVNDWELGLNRRPFRHLDWPEIVEMAGRGVTFGSHGASHDDLTRLPARAVQSDLARSRAAIESRLGSPVRTVSYPFGRYNDAVKDAAREAGFEAAFSLYPKHRNARFDPFAIRRNGVYFIDPVALIETKLQPGPLFWLEEMKCRAINSVAVLTPLLKRSSPGGRGPGT